MTTEDVALAALWLRDMGQHGLADAPAYLTAQERLLLYALVNAAAGDYLEVGTLHGGSAVIAALASHRSRRLVLVDPGEAVAIDPDIERAIGGRAEFVRERSPSALARLAGRLFGLAFIDGDHARAAVLADARAAWPLVSLGGTLLYHDSYNPEVWAGIADFLADEPDGLDTHCQLPGAPHYQDGQQWGGLYLVRKAP